MKQVKCPLFKWFLFTPTYRYKGFKGNCSMTFIDQFKALHQCNKYCKMLGLKSLQNNSQKPKKASIGKGRAQTNPASVKTPEPGTPTEKKA